MQKTITTNKVLAALSVIFFLLALLAETILFNLLTPPSTDIFQYPELWASAEFAYWLGAFSEGWLLSIGVMSLFPKLNISRVTRAIAILLPCIAVAITLNIRGVLWTF